MRPSMRDPAEVPRRRSSLWSCVIWVWNKTSSDEWGLPQWQYLKLNSGVRREVGRRRGGRQAERKRWGDVRRNAERNSSRLGERESEVWLLQCLSTAVRGLHVWCVYMWMCTCIKALMMSVCVCTLSSANVMLPSLVGHQKPALAENQLQVRSLALSLSVRGPRWRECNHSARIPKSLTVVWGGSATTVISNWKIVRAEKHRYEDWRLC